MNNEQEMQFADPAWEPKVTREFDAVTSSEAVHSHVNQPPTFQADEADKDYAHGYRAQNARTAGREIPSQPQQPSEQNPPPFTQQQAPFQGQQSPPLSQQIQALYQRLPRWAWWIIGIVIVSNIVQTAANQGGAAGAFFGLLIVGALVLVGWLIITRRLRVSLAGETQAAETRTFMVGAQPTLLLKNRAGSIRLHAGQEGQVAISTTRRGHVFSPRLDRDVPIMYQQDQASNTITARTGGWYLFGKNTITFDVTVPPQSNLELRSDFGSISVENIAGQMNLRTDAGTIKASQVMLQGKSRLKTDAGTIDFSGSLAPNGTYALDTDLGTINATLSADSSFELNAKTDLGTISTNLPLVSQQRNKLSGIVGSTPTSRLKVKTDVGTITIQQQ